MRRKRIYLRENHSFPYNLHIGYWDGKSGYPDRDFRSCVSLPAGIKWEDAKKEMTIFLKKNRDIYC